MNLPTDQGRNCVLRHRFVFTLAAMLLIVHWAAPAFHPFALPRSAGQSIQSYYALMEIGPCHGVLPRLRARAPGAEITLLKPKRSLAPFDDSEAGFFGKLRFEPASNRAPALQAEQGAPHGTLPTQSFRARAPPHATA